MGAEACIMMRAAVYIGLLVFAVALVADSDAISFDDLVARAEEANHPKPKKHVEVEQPDLEMEEWSTDHLLGLDVPPPSDMFDNLISSSKPAHHKRVVHKKPVKKHVVHKAKKVVRKVAKKAHVAKVHKHIKKVHKVVEEEEDSSSAYAESLLGELDHHTHKKAKKAHKKVHKKAHKKAHKVSTPKARPATLPEHKVHMLGGAGLLEAEDDEDEAPVVHKAHKKKAHMLQAPSLVQHKTHKKAKKAHKKAKKVAHKKAHKKAHKEESTASILDGLTSAHKDEEDSFEEDDDDFDAPSVSALPRASAPAPAHKMKSFNGLQGMATAMLEENDKKDQAQATAAKKKAAAAAKEAAVQKKRQEDLEKRSGGNFVHLDLSGDEADEEDDKEDKAIPSLDSFMEDDDDDDGF